MAIAQQVAPRKATRQVDLDLNNDGRADLVTYYAGTGSAETLLRREADLNLDGQVDVITEFDEQGEFEKESFDGDFDGRFDWVDFYENGVRVRAEIDTDYNGQPDFFSYYSAGVPIKKGRDVDGDGEVDFWERFDTSGAVVAKGSEFDVRDSTEAQSEDPQNAEGQ